MNRVLIFTLVLLTFLLAACGEQLAPATPAPTPIPSTPVPAPPTPSAQVNVDNEFWYGTISYEGVPIPGGMGFWQTGSSVTTVIAFTGSDGEVMTFPLMTGTLEGYNLTINHTDSVGDTATIFGTFDQSQTSFDGTFTLLVGGERTMLTLAMTYQGPLGAQMRTQMQTQGVVTLKELVEQLK